MIDTENKYIPPPNNLPEITQSELNEVLESHSLFLRGQIGGKRAMLQYKDLSALNFHNHDLSHADFTGSMFVGADLSLGIYKCACFFACDLRNADLSHADLSRTDLRGAYLAGANLSGADLSDADMRCGKIMQEVKKKGLVNRKRSGGEGAKTILTGAKLNHANMSKIRANNADFTDADLSSANISRANFNGATLKGANLNRTDFTCSNLTNVDMRYAILSGTILKDIDSFGMDKSNSITNEDIGNKLEDRKRTLEELLELHTLWVKSAGKEGERLDLSNYDLRNVEGLRHHPLTALLAKDAFFINQDLSNSSMQSSILDGSDFRDCYMENIDLRGSSLKYAKLTRANLCGARLSPLQFKNKDGSSRLSRVNLSGADLRFANMQQIDLRDAVLMGADLTYANLGDADLRRADLTGALIKGTDLTGAILDGAIINFDNI